MTICKPPPQRVTLFIQCIVDGIYPEVAEAMVRIFERLNIAVDYPQDQTCCGQPAFNAGYRQAARQAARHFIEVFETAPLIVCPSGSCVVMVRHHYTELFTDFQHRMGPATAATYRALPEGPELRNRAHAIRMQAIDNLDILLETLADNVRKNGGHVFFAPTAQAAVDYCLDLARRHRVKSVVKGKSMVTEEVGLNDALEHAGIEVNETDLGEYIIQLAGEKPSHIIAPAIHKTRDQVDACLPKSWASLTPTIRRP